MPTSDPSLQFLRWYKDAVAAEPDVPDAASLATVDPQGRPSNRMVLVKEHGPQGFVFYTNLDSPKAHHLSDRPHAALCFHWKSLGRQVRVEGSITPLSDHENDAYFASRPRLSRIGAWASHQSQPLASRFSFLRAVVRHTLRFPGEVPRPDFWGGFRLLPQRMEFWQVHAGRLHHREEFLLESSHWRRRLLQP